MSIVLPAAPGTTMRTARVGYACALAIRETAGSAAAPAARCRNCRRGSFILNLPYIIRSQRRRHFEAERPRGLGRESENSELRDAGLFLMTPSSRHRASLRKGVPSDG